jgi:hypothetical protein
VLGSDAEDDGALSRRHWLARSAGLLISTCALPARADLEGLEVVMKLAEAAIPDLGIVLDSDTPNVALALPIQIHVWERKGVCTSAGCPYSPWLNALLEPRWASGGHGLAGLGGLRAYFPLRRAVGSGAPSLSLDVAAVVDGGGVGFALGGGPSVEATPFAQMLTPRYRYVWAAELRHEIYFDLYSFGLGAAPR